MAAEKNPFLDPNYGLEPEQKAAANPFLDPNYGKETDGPLARGFNKAGQSMKMTAQLAGGDTEGVAQTVKDAADYAQANPSRPEGQKLMEAWDKGDGVLGGIGNVARQVKSDYDEAKGFIPGMKAVGRDLRAMGEGIVEQVPNMIAPTVGMVGGAAAGSPAGGPAGAVAGGWVGASAGNALVEGGDQIQTAIQKAGIDPRDTAAVRAYLDANGDQLLKQTAIKGGVIGAVDTATAGLAHFLLTGPGKAAAGRALSEMGVDVADKAAVKTATQSDEFAKIIANDAAYQASKQGVGNVARNATAAGLEPAGEFAGEYLGQGLASGDWDTKNAALEALSSVGQSGAMFAGQKAWQYATSPAQAKAEPGQAPGSGPNQAPTASPATPPPLALPAPTYTGTPNDQVLQAEAERANAVAEAEARAAGIYQQRADFEAAQQGQPEQPPVNAGLELVRQAYAAQLDALQQQEQGQPPVPQSAPPDGRAALEAQAAQAQAQREADRAVMGPDDEILQSTGADQPPHRAMGIDPAAGPLSAGAAIAVDTGVAGQMQAAAQAVTAQDAAPQQAAGPLAGSPLDAGARFVAGEKWIKPGRSGYVIDRVSDDGKMAVARNGNDTFTIGLDVETANGWRPEGRDLGAAQQDPAAAWNSMSTPERAAVAGRVGLPPVIANNIPRTGWEGLNSDLQARISKAMAPADGASPSTPAQGSRNGRTADLQDNARLAAQGGAQGRADVAGSAGDLVQRSDGAAGAGMGAASAGSVRGGAPVEPAGTAGDGRGAVGQAAPFRPKNLVQLVRDAGGVSIDRKADINQDSRTVGVFRKGGMDLDGLAELLQQNGFMTDADVRGSTSGAERAAELLRAALAGERVLSMNDADEAMGRDAEAQYRDEIRRKASEYGIRTTFRPFGDVERDVLARDGELAPEDMGAYDYNEASIEEQDAFDAIDALIDSAPQLSPMEALQALGFTEDEIRAEIENAGSQGRTGKADAGTAQERATNDRQGAQDEAAGSALESYTEQDLAARDEAQRLADESRAKAERDADNKARADADRDTFSLTGSDRPADVLAAQGHGGLFDAPTAAAAAPKAQAAPTKANPGARWDSLTAEQRAAILTQPGGWSTSAGGLNVIGKQLAGKGWEQITAGTRSTIERLMEKARNQEPIKNESRADAGLVVESTPADQEPVKNLADDFMLRPVEVMEHLIAAGEAKALYKEAGVKTADAFGSLPVEAQAGAYANYVQAGGKAAPPATEGYNDRVRRREREARIGRLQEDQTITQANGKPFKTEVSAQAFSDDNELGDTHEAVARDGGFVLQKLPPARRPSAIARQEQRRAADPETQRQDAAFARAEKIGPAAEAAVTAYENGDTSIEEFEAALDAADQPAVGNAPGPLEALFSDLNSGSTRKANKAKKAAAKLPQAARIEYVQANFHDILMQMMEAGALEVNGFATLTEDNAPCL